MHPLIRIAVIFLFTLTYQCICRIPCSAGNIDNIRQAVTSVVKIDRRDGKHISAVRVGENLILSAAHCLLGSDGMSKPQGNFPLTITVKGEKHQLRIVEIGNYRPKEGLMQDWVLLEAVEGPSVFESIGIAEFPDQKEMDTILHDMGDFSKSRKGAVVWSASFPAAFMRIFPRPGYDEEGIFLSKGHLKTHDAYRTLLLFEFTRHWYYDEENTKRRPRFTFDLDNDWKKLEDAQEPWNDIFRVFDQYRNDGDPILYHTADYSYGSSGGGIFVEKSGHLLGIIPLSAMAGSPQQTYCVTESLFRIDVICRQSTVLSAFVPCARLK